MCCPDNALIQEAATATASTANRFDSGFPAINCSSFIKELIVKMLYGFLAGVYVSGAVATFLYVGFFCVLGGNSADLWKPVAYAILWPIMLPLFLSGRAG